MRTHIYLSSSLLLLPIVSSCDGEARGQTLIVGVEAPDAGQPEASTANQSAAPGSVNAPTRGAPSNPASDFSVAIRNAAGQELTSLTLPCGSPCADVEAQARGGTAPYSFTWDDGSVAPQRRLCPAASGSVSVSVRDTAVHAAEFGHDPRTQTATLKLELLQCVDAGSVDAGTDAGTDAGVKPFASCQADEGPRCELDAGNVLPEDVTVDVPGATVRYFAHGAALPAGRYRISYVDGCNTYGVLIGWSVHGATSGGPGIFGCWLVRDDAPFLQTPGTELYPEMGKGEVPTYEECVALNCKVAPIEFDFAGGRLGVMRDGGGELGAVDDDYGERIGGKSPTFRLTRLDPCPTR